MPACRKTDDTNLGRINMPLRGMTPDDPYGPLHVHQGHWVEITIFGKAVLQDESSDAMSLEVVGDIDSCLLYTSDAADE